MVVCASANGRTVWQWNLMYPKTSNLMWETWTFLFIELLIGMSKVSYWLVFFFFFFWRKLFHSVSGNQHQFMNTLQYLFFWYWIHNRTIFPLSLITYKKSIQPLCCNREALEKTLQTWRSPAVHSLLMTLSDFCSTTFLPHLQFQIPV